MPQPARSRRREKLPPGLAPRLVAARAVAETLRRGAALDESLDVLSQEAALEPRDDALARAIAVSTFRRFATIRDALAARLTKGLPKDHGFLALLATGAAQILFLEVPDHAAVDLAVTTARLDPKSQHLAKLVNAVLRGIGRERETILAGAERIEAPDWLIARWRGRYGEEAATRIGAAHRAGATLDLTPRGDPEALREALAPVTEAVLLPTGSLRLPRGVPVAELPGYREGAFWVQDAAAALPARLVNAKPGERIADLCAAPGGKTAQLAAAGAQVIAVDRSERRLERLGANMARLGLDVETRALDVLTLEAEPFDAILLDAPCSATGTLRRHPDVAWAKRESDVAKLADLQARLLDKAATLLKPGGRLVFCTCSLEPEEGEDGAAAFLARRSDMVQDPVEAGEWPGIGPFLTPGGDLRTLPSVDDTTWPGAIDGFFAARFRRR